MLQIDFDFPGRILIGILAMILVTLFPLQYLAQSENENIAGHVDEKTQSFSDSIRDKGYLDASMYEEYQNYLAKTGELYDLQIEDIHPVTGEDMMWNCDHEHTYSSSVPTRNTSKNNAVTLSSRKTPVGLEPLTVNHDMHDNVAVVENTTLNRLSLLSTHTHTADCYIGHNHTASGCQRGYVCCNNQNLYFYETYPSYGYYVQTWKCRSCSTIVAEVQQQATYSHGNFYLYVLRQSKLSNGLQLKCISGTYYDSAGDWLGTYDARAFYLEVQSMSYAEKNALNTCQKLYARFPVLNKYNPADYEFYEFNPPYACGFTTEDTTPICDQVVTSITATNPNQTIKQGQSIVTTATATYFDGHTDTVSCSVSGFNTNAVGTQTVTLSYSGRVDNAITWGTKTCYAIVTVESAAKKCTAELGHPDYDGNLAACPVCAAIAGITASNQTFTYDGNHHEITIGNTTGATINVAYDIDPSTNINWQWNTGPVACGVFQVHIYVLVYNSLSGTWGDYFVMERYITIQARLSSITVTPSNQSIQRYTAPAFSVTAYYEDGSSVALLNGYSVSGINANNIGLQSATVSYTNNGITKTATAQVTVTGLIKVCPRCNNTYELGADDVDHGCPRCKTILAGIKVTPEYLEVTQGASLPITVKAVMNDGSFNHITAWTSNYNPNALGLQTVTIEYGGYAAIISVWVNEMLVTCPICQTQYSPTLGKCPVCSTKVVSITVSPNIITVNQYEDIPLNVVVTYADGSSSTVTDWSIDKTSSVAGTFTTTVLYQSASSTFTLKVISTTSVTCSICGTIYEPSENPKGCPVCSKTITGIEAYLTSGSNLVQYGSTPTLVIVVIYKDTHRELMEDGYTIENFNAFLLGEQTVKILYKEFVTLLDIKVVNTLTSITCPNGHIYYLNEDGSDPGCTYCSVSVNLDTVIYYEITYVNEIIEKVYTDGIYYFQTGNYITVHVYKKNKSILDKMQNMFFKLTILGRKEDYSYGGEVF